MNRRESPHAVRVVVGRNPVLEALRAGKGTVRRILIASGIRWKGQEELEARAQADGVPIQVVEREVLDRMAGPVPHQGVVAEVIAAPVGSWEELLRQAESLSFGLIVLLDQVQDPHNVGAILRSAEAAGALAVIAPRHGAPDLTPAVLKAAAGAAEHLPYLRVPNLARAIERLQEIGYWVFGAESRTGEHVLPYHRVEYPPKTALVVGSEGRGLRRLIRERCDQFVHIPLYGTIESLNVSVATGILLFAVRRFWEEQGGHGHEVRTSG